MDERIRERARSHVEDSFPTTLDSMSPEFKQAFIESHVVFALSEHDAATEQCCKDMCIDCANGEKVSRGISGYFHTKQSKATGEQYVTCKAAAIRARVVQEKKA